MARKMTAREAYEALAFNMKTDPGQVSGYYSVGVEVPPRRGASFSMRYYTVPSIKAGWRMLMTKMARKKVGMIGELVLFDDTGRYSVGLGGFIRRTGGHLEEFPADPNRGALYRQRSQRS